MRYIVVRKQHYNISSKEMNVTTMTIAVKSIVNSVTDSDVVIASRNKMQRSVRECYYRQKHKPRPRTNTKPVVV